MIRQFLLYTCKHASARDNRLETTAPTARAKYSIGLNNHVTEFAGIIFCTPQQLSTKHQTCRNARANIQIDKMIRFGSNAPAQFSQCRRVNIIIQRNGDSKTIAYLSRKGNRTLDRQVHRFQPDASLRVDLTDKSDADRTRCWSIPIAQKAFQC